MYLAELYNQNNNVSINSTHYALKKFGNKIIIHNNASILELGTGDGRATVEALLPILPKDLKELLLSDKSEAMLQHAKKMPELSKMDFIQLDMDSKNIPEKLRNRFDCIFSFMVLHFSRDTRQCIQNIYDMLKPGGQTFCTFVAPTTGDYAWAVLERHPKWSKYDPKPFVSPYYGNPKLLEIYQNLLESCGFQNIVVSRQDHRYEFSSEKEYKGIMKAANLSVNKIPKELLEEYLEDYYNLIKQDKLWTFDKTKDGEECVSVIMKMVVIHAKKPQCL